MKAKLKSVAEELREDLERCPDLRAQQLIDLDETISDLIVRFEQTMSADQGEDWAELKEKIDELREYAQIAKMRLLYGDEHLPSKLDAMSDSLEECDEVKAAIEVERDAHRSTGVSDIFKALLMWKDSPEERMR
ncbi:hypothetical protein [Rubritalea tangerina]|uniref:Peptide chain release factor domain-containing protein n=1 Tax=Rubritalea tangerina TaxID=430798 RepID=A0ABW4ZD27_9BACT